MNNKVFKYIFGLMILSALMMVGCGSKEQSVIRQDSPETAVIRLSESWRTSGNSPAIRVDSNNNFVRQATADDDEQTTTSDTSTSKITLTDFSGNSYDLLIVDKEVEGNVASITTNFVYETGYLVIVFNLIFDDGKWWIEDVSVTDNNGSSPTPIPTTDDYNISGYIRYKDTNNKDVFVHAATVQAFLINEEDGSYEFAGSTITDKSGYYKIDLNKTGEGKYMIEVAKEGMESQTIIIELKKDTNERPTQNGRI